MASHNSRFKVPSYIPVNGQIINNESLKSEQYLDNISEWTIKQRMVLNEKKTKAMIVNFTDKYQFSTRLRLNNANVDLVESMKILGTIFNSRLDWDQNCKEIVNKVNKRMVFLRKVHSFGANKDEMADLWVTYCRSVLWQGGLTLENKKSLKRTQKSFAKLILKRRYTTYEQALSILKLEKLDIRRDQLCLNFARKCTTNKKTAHIFPLNKKKTQLPIKKTI